MDGRVICPHCGKAVHTYRTASTYDFKEADRRMHRMGMQGSGLSIGCFMWSELTGPAYFTAHNCAGDHKPVKGKEGEK